MLTVAPLETARFGLRIFRATPRHLDVRELVGQLLAEGIDVAILRVPSRLARDVSDFAAFGLPTIHADTLVSYECALQEMPEQTETLPQGVIIDVAQEADRPAIAALVDAVFAEYPGHYAANPLLDPAAATAGYREWALSHLHSPNRLMWVARVGDRIASIACSAFDTATGECQGVLHGVHPDFVRGGIYRALIRHTHQYFRRHGFRRLTIQTQAWNAPVQRVWAGEGFVLGDVYETFHINALLDPRHDVAYRGPLRFGDPTVNSASAEILRAMSTAIGIDSGYPAISTVVVLAAMPTGSSYALKIRAYASARPAGRILVGTVHDADDRVCALARLEVATPP